MHYMLTLRKMVGSGEIVTVCQSVIILNDRIEQVTDIFVEYPYIICFTVVGCRYQVQIRSSDNLEVLNSISIASADRISRCYD